MKSGCPPHLNYGRRARVSMWDKVALEDPVSHALMAARLETSTAGKGGDGEVELVGQLWPCMGML